MRETTADANCRLRRTDGFAVYRWTDGSSGDEAGPHQRSGPTRLSFVPGMTGKLMFSNAVSCLAPLLAPICVDLYLRKVGF